MKKNNEIVNRTMIALGYTSKRELAKALKISPSNLNNKMNSGSIRTLLIDVAINNNVNVEWLLTGQGSMSAGHGTGTHIGEQQPPYHQNVAQHAPDMTPFPSILPTTRTQDLLSKTAAIIESRTLFSDALKSNIEAFSVGLTLERDLAASRAMLNSHTTTIEQQGKMIEDQNTRMNTIEEKLRSMETKKAG
jgi:biotin operon repressor